MKPAPNILSTVDKLFVDRDGPIQRFRSDVQADNTDKHVYFISGEHTIGKSWFVYKIYNECNSKGWLTVLIDFSYPASGITNYLSILKEVQLELEQPFRKYQEEINKALSLPPSIQIQTGAGSGGEGIHISGRAKLEDVSIQGGPIAARDNITVINNFYERLDRISATVLQLHILSKITEAFFKDLLEYVGNKPIIFFFDNIGKDREGKDILDSQTRRWLIEDFVSRLCERLPSARFVITQEGDLDSSLQTALYTIAKRCTLREFGAEGEPVLEIYQTYLSKNGIPIQTVECLKLVHSILKGRPEKLPLIIDILQGV